MKHKKRLVFLSNIILCAFSIIILYLIVLDFTGEIPSEYNIQIGDDHIINSKFPFSFSLDSKFDKIIEVNPLDDMPNSALHLSSGGVELKTRGKGSADLHYKVFGFIPYKTVKVNVVPRVKVIPGGHSIGVKLNTDGVLVVGIAKITDEEGQEHNLAEKNGIRIGDSLLRINGRKVENSLHVADLVQRSIGDEIQLTMKREDKEFDTTVIPVKSSQDGEYKLGLWVRDKTAGVGTLTFYHKASKKFGALGHGIADIDTGALMSVKDGDIMNSKVIDIEKGKKGRPGEIRGMFHDVNNPIGSLEKNTAHGIYGEIEKLEGGRYNESMEIAYQHEIKEGAAYILTTLDDNTIEKYDIEILRTISQSRPDGKSMVIRVTDSKLLNKTGGIVQGMSGSPIIQNNRVIGAVTHVLVNDPTKGYGIYIEWMLEESGASDAIRQQ
ncbi:SpoIVB peptidase [Alkaliphilus hydrothermalis]|uniref:Stage IV sporulation protein B n=1 Tax=Alkaliphilus hydrothermalis TaxID=1482730 RepID=A0ABS2NMB4_9FIRM|nr:SpoIVB peptidase [Alkaliphilus hydrothermalis]MBM7614016.1 stage IV sporulation protein B [Alkaliphilus hydrothermalis]